MPSALPAISRSRRAVIIGGSMSGLFTAAFLRQIGWDTDVYERSTVELAGSGAASGTAGSSAEERRRYPRRGPPTRRLGPRTIPSSGDRFRSRARRRSAMRCHRVAAQRGIRANWPGYPPATRPGRVRMPQARQLLGCIADVQTEASLAHSLRVCEDNHDRRQV